MFTRIFDVPAKSAVAFHAGAGNIVRIMDIRGGQVADLVAFVANNTAEKLDQSRTRANNWKFRVSTNDKIYTNRNSVLFTVIEDKVGIHDLTLPPCNSYVYEKILGVGPRDGCFENLAASLKKLGFAPIEIPNPFNLFMDVTYDVEQNVPRIRPAPSRAGDHLDLRVETASLVAISACADDVTECNHGECKPIRVALLDGSTHPDVN